MYGRSRTYVLLAVLLSLTACGDKGPEAEARKQLQRSLTLLYVEPVLTDNMDRLLSTCDFGTELDSASHMLYSMAFCRNRMEVQGNDEVSRVRIEVLEEGADVISDTLLTLYYNLILSDGDTLRRSQKMVKHPDGWKLRMRN